MAPLLIPIAVSLLKEFGPSLVGALGGERAEEVAKTVVGIAEDVAGQPGDEALRVLKSDPALAAQYQARLLEHREKLQALALDAARLAVEQDKVDAGRIASAQDMQKSALVQDDRFSKRFVYWFATAWSVFAMAYFTLVTLVTIPASAVRVSDTILGVLIGTVITGMFQFFMGTTIRSQRKDETIRALSETARG